MTMKEQRIIVGGDIIVRDVFAADIFNMNIRTHYAIMLRQHERVAVKRIGPALWTIDRK